MEAVSKDAKDAGHALIDVLEVAARLGSTPDWVYDQVHWHGMPCCKFSKKMWALPLAVGFSVGTEEALMLAF